MKKTSYYTDQDVEKFMTRSEKRLKHMFCVLSVCSLVCLCGILNVLQTDDSLSESTQRFLIVLGSVALICVCGLGYCYISVRNEHLRYKKMLREQQEEMNALIDEIQAERSMK